MPNTALNKSINFAPAAPDAAKLHPAPLTPTTVCTYVMVGVSDLIADGL